MHFGILAAGEGSRLVSEGVAEPKPLVKLGGEPMISRLIKIFIEAGAESVCVVINDFMPEVRKFLENYEMPDGVELKVKVKTTPSSMHTFAELAEMFEGQGRFIATTVDTVFRADDFKRYAEAYSRLPVGVNGMMAMTDFIDDEKPLYIDVDANLRIINFCDTPPENVKYISAGIYGLDSSAMPVLRQCLESGVSRMRNFQRALISNGLIIDGFPMGKVMDVDHASDIAAAEQFIK